MARRIYGLLPEDGDGAVWIAQQRRGRWMVSRDVDGSLKADDEAVFFAPGTAVARHEVDLPARGDAEARRAAPFAVEDDIAGSPETLHVALGPKQPSSNARVIYLTDDTLMAQWAARVDAIGVKNAAIVPELEVLPDEPLAVDLGDRVLVSADSRKFALDSDMPFDLVRALVRSGGETPGILGVRLAEKLGGEAIAEVADHPLLQLVAMAETREAMVDLRQGRHRTGKTFEALDLRAWRWPGALAAAAAVSWLATAALEASTLRAATEDMRAQARTRYAAAFPSEDPPANLVQAVRRKTSGEAGAASFDFVTGASLLYEGLENVDGATLRSVRFDRGAGALRASVSYPNFGGDAALGETLEALGVSVTIGDSRQDGSTVVGDITLEVDR